VRPDWPAVCLFSYVPAYAAPCPPRTRSGKIRCVGVEVELGQLDVPATLDVVASTLGGTARLEGPTAGCVVGTPLGQFKIELDSLPVRERRYLAPFQQLGVSEESRTAQLIEDSVLRVAKELVPVEVVTPPVPWDRLAELDPLWRALRERGAEDTKSSLLHAFGLHLNPELPDLQVSTIVRTLRAYFLLEDWLTARSDVDLARKVAPYIHPFPEEYRRLVVDPHYAPDLSRFVDDYVTANPTRNRPLDLLPLIREVSSLDLRRQVDAWPKVKARPAFHYRLPNCEISKPGWTPAADWNRWVSVERLAANDALLEELSLAYPKASSDWLELLESRLPPLGEDEAAST
jgi:hypothetical protein